MSSDDERSGVLSLIDSSIPPAAAQFDAFPKLPATYKSRTRSRGGITLFAALLAILLVLNDVAEFIWGWPDYEFDVDPSRNSYMNVNVDMVVNMPCQYLSVDLRDAIGDRLYLSKGFRRDGTKFDIGQATSLKQHAAMLSAREAIAQSRSSRGVFSWASNLWSGEKNGYKPTYNYVPDGSACRIFGSVQVKKVTANLHITTLGHGYSSYQHVDHNKMNLSHVITEFSFGPYFPDIVQPLDYSFEVTHDHFVAYQYFMHVVPTTYIAPRSQPLETHQYSVTHYKRTMKNDQGTPGIFFKFDLDPIALAVHQRTTSFAQLFIRVVGVVGGVFVCTSYALRVGIKTIKTITGNDGEETLAPGAEASGARLRSKWGGGNLRNRPGGGRQSGSGWDSPSYGTPHTGSYTPAGSPFPHSPYPQTAGTSHTPYSPYLNSNGSGLGVNGLPQTPSFGGQQPPPPPSRRISQNLPSGTLLGTPSGNGHQLSLPGTPSYNIFPPTPNPANSGGFPRSPNPDAGFAGNGNGSSAYLPRSPLPGSSHANGSGSSLGSNGVAKDKKD